MNQSQNLTILNERAFTSGDRFIGLSFILQQDNAPCHKNTIIKIFLLENFIETVNWPPQSPDLNVADCSHIEIKSGRIYQQNTFKT